jgi:hypothetical protein
MMAAAFLISTSFVLELFMQTRQVRSTPKLTQSGAKYLYYALRRPVMQALMESSMALTHFVTVMPQYLATILLETGYIRVGVYRHLKTEDIEYVWLTNEGRRALEILDAVS